MGASNAAGSSGPRKVQKVILAYSGGLDTSVMIPWIKEHYDGCEVLAMVADVGQGEGELEGIEEKAVKSGAGRVYVEDLRREFIESYILPTLRAGAVYEQQYLLGTSFARPIIAKRQVEIARREGADALAHGCTGKGNDQVRFELAFQALAPDLKVIAPWREWKLRSREEEIEYADAAGIPVPVTKEKPYSMDRNLWHISYEGGDLEDPWHAADEEMFLWTVPPSEAPDRPALVEIHFERGIPVSIDGEPHDSVAIIERLNELGARHGVGRIDIVENRLVGMKSRGCYETPGGTILYFALRELEQLVLDRETQHYKQMVGLKYADLVYNGQWWSPLRTALDAFVDATGRRMTGDVRVRLFKGSCRSAGRRSPFSLYRRDLATFGTDEVYRQEDAEGFIRLFGLPDKVQSLLEQALDADGNRASA